MFVNCNLGTPAGKIGSVLKHLDPAVPHTITVSGTCHEKIVIDGFSRVSLIARPGAVLEDASNGTRYLVHITDSDRVLIKGFVIRGGDTGVFCARASYCKLMDDTIEEATNRGIQVWHSQLLLVNDTIQRNARGIFGVDARIDATNVIIDNSTADVGIETNGTVIEATNIAVRNSANTGVFLNDSVFSDDGGSFTANGGHGFDVRSGSGAHFINTTVKNNLGIGVHITDNSFADFYFGGTYTNNGYDIDCGTQNGIARWLENATYGSTNCPVPAP